MTRPRPLVRPLIRRAVRRSGARIRYVTPVPPAAAEGLVAKVYTQVERDFGILAPPVVLHSPAPAVLAACWIMVRETLIAASAVDRGTRELVAAAVSAANSCPYCVTIHTSAMSRLGTASLTAQVANGSVGAIADPRLREIARWAWASGQPGGQPGASLPSHPYLTGHFAELAGVAMTFHYLNRMVTIFLDDSPLPAMPTGLRNVLMDKTAQVMLSAEVTPGASDAALALLPAAPAQPGFAWAAGQDRIAAAFDRAAAAIERECGDRISQRVREHVSKELASWNGRPPSLSKSWADDRTARLPAADRAAGRLALLTAMAPYQVTAEDIACFRVGQPADGALITLTSWASMAAVRQIGSWLASPARASS
jgi:AhpD family alkylhydroperoxidase